MGSKSNEELVQLAESTLTELQKVAGWQAGYSDKEKQVYIFNLNTQTTQWESPHTLAEQEDDELGSSQPPSGQPPKYQQPKHPQLPGVASEARSSEDGCQHQRHRQHVGVGP